MKSLSFIGRSRDDLREFPVDARREAGFELMRVQAALEPTHWRPMPTIGAGVREIRIADGGAYRVIYVVLRPASVYVLHAFEKKSQKTAREDLDIATSRYKAIRRHL